MPIASYDEMSPLLSSLQFDVLPQNLRDGGQWQVLLLTIDARVVDCALEAVSVLLSLLRLIFKRRRLLRRSYGRLVACRLSRSDVADFLLCLRIQFSGST